MNVFNIKTGDIMIFEDGFESKVLSIENDDFSSLRITFIKENKDKISLWFAKKSGLAGGTHYRIIKVVSDV